MTDNISFLYYYNNFLVNLKLKKFKKKKDNVIQLEIHAFEKPKIVNQTELQYTKYKGDLVE